MAAAPVSPLSAPTPTPMPEPTRLSQGARIIDTFIAPKKTFNDIRRSAQWWLPFLLFTLVNFGLAYVAEQKIGVQKMMENDMQARPKQQAQYEKATPDQRAVQIKITGIAYYVAGPIFVLILWLVLAGLQFGTFKVASSTDITYSRSLAVVVYAGLPVVLRSVLAAISVLAGASADGFTLGNPIASNPAYFMNAADNPFLYFVMSQMDVFLLWALVLTAIGYATAGKIKTGTAFAVVFGWWAVTTLAFAFLFS
jgi:Yip1 domain